MPSVISLMRVSLPTVSVNRTWYPTRPPRGVPNSSEMRSAIVRAAIRLGWVWPMLVRPSSSRILGSCVVLPDPVSPATMTTWLSRIAAAMSSRRWLTGRSSG